MALGLSCMEELVWLIWAVSFIWFVSLVWLNQTKRINQRNQMNQINQTDPKTVSYAADFFNSLLAGIAEHVGIHLPLLEAG